VQARDLVAARGLLRPPLTERLLQVAPMPIVVVDGWVITWVSTRDVPEAIARQLPAATWVARELAAAARR
jgi:hypothetical protein